MLSSLFIYLAFLHFLGDFVFQSDWMAKNKSSSLKALSLHVSVYSLILLLGSCLVLDHLVALKFTLVNAALHFFVDRFTSKVSSSLFKAGDMHNFFVCVGFDQLIHYACLFSTVEYFV